MFGGEFEWDNFKIYQHSSRGLDRGVVIEYGKNLTKFEHSSDITDVYTHVFPYGIAEDKETGEETVVTLPEEVLPSLIPSFKMAKSISRTSPMSLVKTKG